MDSNRSHKDRASSPKHSLKTFLKEAPGPSNIPPPHKKQHLSLFDDPALFPYKYINLLSGLQPA
ncbi:hypothetical protein J6590_025833 [Homalodisca vitripennis]|nr:hypothetical protein J6590_025833 [Homalodisca vitripennis]